MIAKITFNALPNLYVSIFKHEGENLKSVKKGIKGFWTFEYNAKKKFDNWLNISGPKLSDCTARFKKTH